MWFFFCRVAAADAGVVVAVGVVNVDTVVDVTMAIRENQNGHRYDSKRRNQNFSAPKQET